MEPDTKSGMRRAVGGITILAGLFFFYITVISPSDVYDPIVTAMGLAVLLLAVGIHISLDGW